MRCGHQLTCTTSIPVPRSPKPELLKLLVAGLDAKANGHHHTNGDAHHAPSGRELLRAALADTASLEAYLAPRHVVDVLQDAAPARLSTSQVGRGAERAWDDRQGV